MVAADTWERRTFSADEVWRMVQTGVIREDERVELLEGELVLVPLQSPAHSTLSVVMRLALEGVYGGGYFVRDHSPVEGTVDSIPEPDVAVVRGDPRAFLGRHPTPADVALVVEVSSSSLAIDRKKATIYAKAGYAAYWLVDVEGRRLEMRTGPQPDGTFAKTDIVDEAAAVTAPGAATSVIVRDLLP